jgi:hypothetical protein
MTDRSTSGDHAARRGTGAEWKVTLSFAAWKKSKVEPVIVEVPVNPKKK